MKSMREYINLVESAQEGSADTVIGRFEEFTATLDQNGYVHLTDGEQRVVQSMHLDEWRGFITAMMQTMPQD